ncbi:LysR family transcriptional regulator [Streptomyces sp. NPDC058382]|uniref:LysR family transcriptional regulator n=1 Tax=unclassified Streptomyces TaxID=2593676 RepID=UPI00363B00F9
MVRGLNAARHRSRRVCGAPGPAQVPGSESNERFAAALLPCPTHTEAARALDIHRSTPTTQINRFEKALGRPLIKRSERWRSHHLRPTGVRR